MLCFICIAMVAIMSTTEKYFLYGKEGNLPNSAFINQTQIESLLCCNVSIIKLSCIITFMWQGLASLVGSSKQFPEVHLMSVNNQTSSVQPFSDWNSDVEFLRLQLFQAESVGTVQSFGRPAICLSTPTVRDVYRKRAIWLSPGSLHLSASTLYLSWFLL